MCVHKRSFFKYLITVLLLFSFITIVGNCKPGEKEVVLSYQTWAEHMILGEIFHILLEEKTDIPIKVVELDSSAIQWVAMKEGEIDITPFYTANAYMTVLGDTGMRDPDKVYNYVKEQYKEKFNVIILERLGFYNNYDLAVRPEVAEKYNLKTYSDLAKVADQLKIVTDINFLDRADCYPLLQEKYGMAFKEVIAVGVTIKYPTIANKEADVINNYTTDAKIKELGLIVLEDDKHAFPPYDAVPMVRGEILEMYPEIEEVLNLLAGKISTDEMTEMNYMVEIKMEEPEDVARDFLIKEGLIEE